MKARILVRLKAEIFDAPGNAVLDKLVSLGFGEVVGVKIGKLIELEIESADRDAAKERIENMCKQLLANEVSEDYEIISVE